MSYHISSLFLSQNTIDIYIIIITVIFVVFNIELTSKQTFFAPILSIKIHCLYVIDLRVLTRDYIIYLCLKDNLLYTQLTTLIYHV